MTKEQDKAIGKSKLRPKVNTEVEYLRVWEAFMAGYWAGQGEFASSSGEDEWRYSGARADILMKIGMGDCYFPEENRDD